MKRFLIISFFSFSSNVFADCGAFYLNQRLFRPAKNEASLFSSVKKLDINGNEIQSGDNLRRVVVFENGTAAEGKLAQVHVDEKNSPIYIGFNSETQLLSNDGSGNFLTLKGQDYSQHKDGFGMPVGSPLQASEDVSWFTKQQWAKLNVAPGNQVRLTYPSGVEVVGQVKEMQTDATGIVRVIKFVDNQAEVTLGSKILFEKSWGTYDLLIGTKPINDLAY